MSLTGCHLVLFNKEFALAICISSVCKTQRSKQPRERERERERETEPRSDYDYCEEAVVKSGSRCPNESVSADDTIKERQSLAMASQRWRQEVCKSQCHIGKGMGGIHT